MAGTFSEYERLTRKRSVAATAKRPSVVEFRGPRVIKDEVEAYLADLNSRNGHSIQFDNVQHRLERIDWKCHKTPFRDLELIESPTASALPPTRGMV